MITLWWLEKREKDCKTFFSLYTREGSKVLESVVFNVFSGETGFVYKFDSS